MVFGVVLALGVSAVLGHSHNDYLQPRPLYDALDAGMSSVEADVFLADGKLMVAHSAAETKPGRDLDTLYLAPLERRLSANGGQVVFGQTRPFWLFIDIKADGPACYAAIKERLPMYRQLAAQVGVRFVLSGSRPIAEVVADGGQFASLDGRPEDLGKGYSARLMPVVSQSWASYSKWTGKGKIDPAEAKAVRALADRCHREGKLLRLWATPDSPESWRLQASLGVDLLNTDKPAELMAHFR